MTDENESGADLTEMFAHFGRAAYMSNVLETELALVLLQVEFLTGVREEFIRTKGENFDREKYETDFDGYLEKQLSKTMGALATRVEEFPDLGTELKGRIQNMLKRRNYLVHDYWRESSLLLLDEEGRAGMIDELSKDAENFEALANEIREATKPVRKRLGIKEAVLDQRVETKMVELMGGIILE